MKESIFILTTCTLLFLVGSLAHGASRDPKTLLTGECVGCHEKEKFCDNLGKNERFWKATIGLMESTGADLSKQERAGLITSLSNPSDVTAGVCK